MSLPAPSPSFKAALHHYDGAFDPVVHVLRTSVSRVKKSKIEPLQIISSITASGRAAPTLVLVTTLSLHLLVHKHYTTTILSSYNSHISSFKQRLSKNALLGIHMLSGLAEVFRWHSKAALTGKAPKPDKLDVLFCAAQSLTNLALIKDMGRGVAGITRPAYQAMGILRLASTITAYVKKSASWHEASVKGVNAFLWCRLLIWGLYYAIPKGEMTYSAMYNIGVFVSAILAASEAPVIPYQAHVYVLTVFAISFLNAWTTKQYQRKELLFLPKRKLIEYLCWAGFAELSTIKSIRRASKSSSVTEEKLGDWWTEYPPAEDEFKCCEAKE